MKNIIELKNITKNYGDFTALDHINLEIKEGEFVTLLGPSGCGKTTTLRIIGGFEDPSEGQVYFDGKQINETPANKRSVNTVFQKYALFTHLSVYDNIAFGPKLKKMESHLIEKKVKESLRIVNLEGFEKREISTLSGGQQQRIAIARALINEPKVLLLDEPLGALDLKLRQGMQRELSNMHQKLGITFIYVTHDQEEALSMSDTVVVMNRGKILQIGSPEDVYNEPKTPFVADFIGESNIIPGVMKKDLLVNFANHDFECVDKGFKPNEQIDVVVRPEDIHVTSPNTGMIQAKVTSVNFKGVHYEMTASCNNFEWLIQSTKFRDIDETIGISIIPDHIHIMKRESVNG
ncbi:MAG: ABC transporter ATP-binding protein [Clostridia bacterium]|nr:ABC transporter ATP-binding protein [Clostridia bacterium]